MVITVLTYPYLVLEVPVEYDNYQVITTREEELKNIKEKASELSS